MSGAWLVLTFLLAAAEPAAGDKAAAVRRSARPPVDLVWMVGPVSDGEPEGEPPRETAALRARGARLYEARCAACHGKRGDGRGPHAEALTVKPTDFTIAVYKVRSTPSGTLPVDADLYRTISRGLHGTVMFPWTQLAPSDRWALVYRLKQFSPRFREEKPGAVIVVKGAPPPETDALRAEGRRLYRLVRCEACHGDRGGADGPSADLYENGREARPVLIRDFRKGRFIRGREMTDIFLTLRSGFDGTPMGAYSLSAADLWALSAYVRSLIEEHPLPALPPNWNQPDRAFTRGKKRP